jgi:outer membrane protein TolC
MAILKKFWAILALALTLGLALATGPTGAQTNGPMTSPTPVPSTLPTTSDLAQIQTLTLDNAQRIALSQNPSLAAAAERISQAQARLQQAQAAYWPSLDLNAASSRNWLSDNEAAQALISLRLVDPNATIDDPEDRFNTGLQASWLLFDGFRRKFSVAFSRFGTEESLEARINTQRLLISSVATGYYTAQLAREEIEIGEADEAFNLRQLEVAQAKYRIGTGSLSDALNFEIQANAARSQLIASRQSYEIALVALATLMGLPQAEFPAHLQIAPLKEENPAELQIPTAEPLIQYALAKRPDLMRLHRQQDQAVAQIGIARSGYWPSLVLSGAVDGNRSGNAFFDGDDFGASVALSLRYNLFAGGETRAQVAEARARDREAANNIASLEIDVASEIRESLAALERDLEQLKLQRANTRLVLRNRDLVEKGYQAGQESLVRLNEAQRDLIQAQSRLALARVSLRQAWQTLITSTAENLKPFADMVPARTAEQP